MNNEILAKAKAAQSPEELLQLARENGMSDFTEENAKGYFEVMHKSGELSDEELEQAAGGCKKGGRTVVTVLNSCSHWRCDACNFHMLPSRSSGSNLAPRASYLPEESLRGCRGYGVGYFESSAYHKHHCDCCYYCSYEGGMWYCNNSLHNS